MRWCHNKEVKMSNVFRNALVLSETVVGSILDTRALVLYEQPADIDFNNMEQAESDLLELVDNRKLKEIFTGFADEKYTKISKINGWNAYGVSYIDANIDINSDLCDFPIESGSVITDNAIIQPISIKIQVALPTAFATRIYAEMIKYYQKKKYIMVQTKFAMYRNMVIQAMPFKLENATIDRPLVELNLRQVVEVNPQYVNLSNQNVEVKNTLSASDADTVDIGRTQSNAMAQSLINQEEAMKGF